MSDLQYWIALNFLPDIGPVLARRLLASFGEPETIFSMPVQELKLVQGLGGKRALRIASFNQWDRVQQEIVLADAKGVRMIPLSSPDYSEPLKNIYDAPCLIYVKGDPALLGAPAIAMVGSRDASSYGVQVALKMSHTFGRAGVTVVSGMARGIDTASHRGALDAGGATVAVLGSGIDRPYPASNRDLQKEIESSGAVVSEFPLGTLPGRENFPRRNRIISALSLGTVVVEAALDSGSLITVAYALEQGKDVFAVPGNVTSPGSRGANDLIKKGASLVESAEEVILELKPQLQSVLREDNDVSRNTAPDLSGDEAVLCRCLTSGPVHIDTIVRNIQMPASKALSLLLTLELKGIIRQTGGKHFALA